MNIQKRDSQKRSISHLGEYSLRCPDCKDLDEHRSKNCSKKLITQDSSDSLGVDVVREQALKVQNYQNDDCFPSFTGSQNVEEHLRESHSDISRDDTEKSEIRDSSRSIVDALKEAMSQEKNILRLLKTAAIQTLCISRSYKDIKERQNTAQKAHLEAVARKRNLGVIVSTEEYKSLSRLVCEKFRELETITMTLVLQKKLLFHAVRQMRSCARVLVQVVTDAQSALSTAMELLSYQRCSIDADFSSLETEEREIERLQDILIKKHKLLELILDVADFLNDRAESLTGMHANKELPTTSGNKNGGRDAMPENLIAGDGRVEANAGIQDDQRPSTSGTSSRSGSSRETPDSTTLLT